MKKFYKIIVLLGIIGLCWYGFIWYNDIFKKDATPEKKHEILRDENSEPKEIIPSDVARLNSAILSFEKKSIFGGDVHIELGEICKFYTCDQSFSGFELDGIFNISNALKKIATSNLKASKTTILGKRVAIFSKNEKEKSEVSEKIFLAADIFADFTNLDYGVKILQDVLDKNANNLSDLERVYIEKAVSEINFSVKIQDAILLQKDAI